ncbi:MAG: DMT family transporter [Phycisphaerales bacterium]|nr:DMT family transporter [Phycisphaerales bacterium]
MLTETQQGIAAGLGASALWVATSLLFAAATRRLGATRTNLLRLLVALTLHLIAFWILSGRLLPQAAPRQTALLAFSGFVGLSICDQCRLLAFLRLGPRLTLLVGTLEPVFGVLLAMIFFSEGLSWRLALGVCMVVGGVAWSVLERTATSSPHAPTGSAAWRWGLAFAIVAAFLQVAGFALSKEAMRADEAAGISALPPQHATLLRIFFAVITLLPFVAWRSARDLRRGLRRSLQKPGEHGRGVLLASLGAATGPFLGVWCSLFALAHAPMSIAQTMLSLAPVFILPAVVLIFKERVSPRAWLGAAIAVAGAAVVAMSKTG